MQKGYTNLLKSKRKCLIFMVAGYCLTQQAATIRFKSKNSYQKPQICSMHPIEIEGKTQKSRRLLERYFSSHNLWWKKSIKQYLTWQDIHTLNIWEVWCTNQWYFSPPYKFEPEDKRKCSNLENNGLLKHLIWQRIMKSKRPCWTKYNQVHLNSSMSICQKIKAESHCLQALEIKKTVMDQV